MTTPWPPEVLDCAKRLAKSLGYEECCIHEVNGRIEVYRHLIWDKVSERSTLRIFPSKSKSIDCAWHTLDPRDPTVWGALIGKDKVQKLVYYYEKSYLGGRFIAGHKNISTDPGLAVCESYNELKSNGRGKAKPPQKFSTEEICGFFEVPIEILR